MPDWQITQEDIEDELDMLEEEAEERPELNALLENAPERDEDGNLIDYDPQDRPQEER